MLHKVGVYLVLSMAVMAACAASTPLNPAPIIGVLGVPAALGCDTLYLTSSYARPLAPGLAGSCFSAVYAQWIAAAGGQVVPIPFDLPHAQLKALYYQLNGILFTGGGLDLKLDSPYVQTAKFLYDLVTSNPKDHVPLWGTCMGFQLLNILTAWNESVLCEYCYDSENIPLALELTPTAPASRLIKALGAPAVTVLSTQNVTMNFHHDGIPPNVHEANPKLKAFYDVISINHDRKGNPFISTMEAKNWPIYGAQWHAERNQFQFTPADDIPHTSESIMAMQTMARFFVDEARKNSHKFTDPNQLQDLLIYNYCPTNHGYGSATYYFGANSTTTMMP